MAAKLFGDWRRAALLMNKVGMAIRRGTEKGLRKATAEAERTVIKHIQNQDLPWEPLSEAYLARKLRLNLSEQIYIATSSYMQAITSRVDAARLMGMVGVMRSAQRADGTVFGDIPSTLEFGTKDGTIPPRPLWRPTFAEMQPRVHELVRQEIAKAVKGL